MTHITTQEALDDKVVDWTTNAPGTGRVRLGMTVPYGEVPRDDLAGVLVELVHTPRVQRVILELTACDTPIKEALQLPVVPEVCDIPPAAG